MSVVVADLDGDAVPDLVSADLYGDAVSVVLGSGNGTFQAAVSYPAGDGPSSSAWPISMAMPSSTWSPPTI